MSEAIHDDATFSEEDAAKIIYQIADGIKHMHSHDIVHRYSLTITIKKIGLVRDIKPENVLCQVRPPDNQVVLKVTHAKFFFHRNIETCFKMKRGIDLLS